MASPNRFHFRVLSIFFSVILLLIFTETLHVGAGYQVSVPITGGDIYQLNLYGENDAYYSYPGGHKGVDYWEDLGTDVRVIAGGQVKDVVESYANGDATPGGFGNFVLIKHTKQHYVRQNNGTTIAQLGYVYSIYGHLKQNSVVVNEGNNVYQGQKIAEVDDTGYSDINHLHLQIIVDENGSHEVGNDYNWTENTSRNPEIWLKPYTDTARAIGLVTDENGDPASGKFITGMDKPWSAYGSSETYDDPSLNPDDYFGENFATTDVSPGTYQLIARNTSPSGTQFKDLGTHIFVAGQTTYVGVYPVFLPDVRAGTSGGTRSIIIVRNNGDVPADVITTFFQTSSTVAAQRQDVIESKAILEFQPSVNFTWGSALVVGSQDLSVMVLQYETSGKDARAAYTGIREPSTEIHVPLLHANNSGWYSQLFIQNTGFETANVQIQFYPWSGYGLYCSLTNRTIAAFTTRVFDLRTMGEGCVTDQQQGEPTFIGSAYIKNTSSDPNNQQPLAVTSTQYDMVGSDMVSLMESNRSWDEAPLAYAPLIQNYNSTLQWVSGLAMQNASSSTNTLQVIFRNYNGSQCGGTDTYSSILSRYIGIDILPPGTGVCPTVISGRILGLNNRDVAASVNQRYNTTYYPEYWADYPAITIPSQNVVVPRWKDLSSAVTAVAIRNTSNQSASGTVTFYYADGDPVNDHVSFSLAGYGSVIVTAPVPYFYGSAEVSSSKPVAVVINHFEWYSNADLIMSHAGDHIP